MFDDIIRDNLSPEPSKESKIDQKKLKDVKHVAIAEIYKAADKIRDFANTLINASEAEKHAIIMYCDYIQNCDKLLHDELYPNCPK